MVWVLGGDVVQAVVSAGEVAGVCGGVQLHEVY